MKLGRRLVAVAAVLVLLGVFGVHQRPDPLQLGAVVSAPELVSLEGASALPDSLRGRVVVLNFWATWCPPCVQEMPSLEALHRALAPEGLLVIGVSVDHDETELRDFVSSAGISFPILWDRGGRVAAETYRTSEFPTTLVIDAEGRLRERRVGPAEWHGPEALDDFREMIREGRAASTP